MLICFFLYKINLLQKKYFELPGYTLVYDLARINSFGGVAIYVHDSFSFARLDIDTFKQDSLVCERMYLEIYNKDASFHKYGIGSVYRRPSDLLDDLTQFIEEFSETLSNIHAVSRQAYVNGDYNIDLLQLHTNTHYNAFYEHITEQGFFPKITRSTRSFGNSHTLIDNVLTNNLCKQHTSGILTHQISDHFMTFSIVEGNIKNIKEPIKYVEMQNINSASIINFKNSVGNSDLFSQFDLSLDANPNDNYNILSSILQQAKNRHIPKKIQRLNRRKHCIEPWMNKELLTLINKKNDKYRDWKSTNNDVEYEVKKINFKTFEKIVKDNIRAAKREYYFKTFTSQKNDIKKTWKTIDETLNRRKNKSKFPSVFIVNNRSIADQNEIADQFNIFFSNIGSTLSDSIEIADSTLDFTDYLNNPAEHHFHFNTITESETLSIINKLKNKNSSGKDEISNKLLKSIKDEIAKPLTIIINQSLKTGVFPDALKIAKVKPLFLRFLIHSYCNQKMRVKWNGSLSGTFSASNGVKQGGVLSPLLFTVYLDQLILALKESGIGCHLNGMFVGAFIYADDVTLLAPTSMALKAMLSICTDFAASHNLLFNASKTKCMYFNNAGSQLQNTAKFMGRPIEYVDCTDILGVSVTSRIKERNVNSSVQKFYCRVNSVLYDFKDIPCDVKAKLLDSYCLDVYGSQLWNYSKHDVDMFFTAWRKSIRRLWKIPNTTHCNLLSSINSSVPIVINLERRCAKFIWSCLNSDNSIVKTIANSAKCSSVSNFGDNYRYLSYKYKIGNHVWNSPLCKLLKCFDSYMSHSITVFPEGSFIRDLCLMRDDYSVFNNCAITKEELFFLINHLCTS